MKSDFVEVCILGKTVGLKGALKLHDRSDFPNQFKKGAKFYDINSKEFVIKSYDRNNNLVIFENYDSIDLAKTLVNYILYRSINDTIRDCKLAKDEFFYFDIVGCNVFEDKILLGEVIDILEVGAGFLFSIKTEDDLVKAGLNSNFYIPYNDNFTQNIDIKSKKIHVKNSLDILKNS
ncbi:16S rRNA processing protein RimM [Campylobacter fetus subsp. venerealis]|uniref:ribosome maturation factor RimM n=1 Tax=Campylobacter fetus TaxID=196 RepID=UPI0018E7CC18|nr:ribosome maturation factor RimM [Campylobacter fetus]QQF51819.1 16S rRNA processing protein RimM [Campylobacter fetus subsp. venerealis]